MAILQQRASDVYVREFDLSHIVTGASSSNAAAVVVSNKGSLVPEHFTQADTFLNHYYNRSDPSIPISVQSTLNYFHEGNSLWVVRAHGTDYKFSGLLLVQDGAKTELIPLTDGTDDPEDIDFEDIALNNKYILGLFYPKLGPGSYADSYQVSITSGNIDPPANLEATTSDKGGVLNPATYGYSVSSITPDGETVIGNVAIVTISGQGATYSNTITWDPVPGALGYRVYGRGDEVSEQKRLAEVGQGTYSFVDTGEIVPDDFSPITNPDDAAAPIPIFTVNIRAEGATENFDCTLEEFTDEDGVAMEMEAKINPFSEYMNFKSNVPNLIVVPKRVTSVPAWTNLEGGDSGTVPTNFDVSRAWEVFDDREKYDINIMINSGHSYPNVQLNMDRIAQSRGDAVPLLDVPSARQKYRQAINYRNLDLGLSSSYSALFSADILQEDNINGRERFVPFSGYAAALCARTDRVANPSFSIAGLNRGLVNALGYRESYDSGQSTELYKAQVNYLRSFTNIGTALWEQRTLSGKDSALSWLSVRRILNVIKVSLYRAGLYIIQEPNDEFTARQVVSMFEEYLEAIKNARGIHSYTVVADASNNPLAFINGGILRCSVIIIPILPVHELQVDVAISKQGVSFEETLTALYGG